MVAALFMDSRIMRKSTFIIFLSVISAIALVVLWFWALAPVLVPLVSYNATEFTAADVVRRVWHFRLVQPEWVSSPTDYVRWSQAESLARCVVVALGWLSSIGLIAWNRLAGHRNVPPETIPQPVVAH